MSLTFRKRNIIHLEQEVVVLLKSDQSKFCYPVKLIYLVKPLPENEPNYKVLFIVPKRYVKKAVKRNLAKRRIKEAFRINQGLLSSEALNQKQILLCFMYVSSEVLPFKQIEKSVVTILKNVTNTSD